VLRRNFLLRVVTEIAGGLAVLGIFLWLAGGKEFIEKNSAWLFVDWATFVVPSGALQIDSEISARNGVVTVCNSSGKKWLGGLVQITRGTFAGDHPAEEQEIGLLAELKRMDLGECVRIPLEEFTHPTWKRIPGPRSLQPTKIDLVVKLEADGYSSKTMGRSRPTQ